MHVYIYTRFCINSGNLSIPIGHPRIPRDIFVGECGEPKFAEVDMEEYNRIHKSL